MTNTTDRRLKTVEAHGVLGEFHHKFTFAESGAFAIVYGPNGVGKTKTLEVVAAVSKLDFSDLIHLPFESAKLSFSDNSYLQVSKLNPQPPNDSDSETRPDGTASAPDFLVTMFDAASGRQIESAVTSSANFLVWLRQTTSYMPIDGTEFWIDTRDDDVIAFDQLRRAYFHRFRNETRKRTSGEELDPLVQEFIAGLDIRLIETQRLTMTDVEPSRHRGYPSAPSVVPTVIQYSNQIRSRLNDNLSSNSRLTQQLDSTFPRRMLERGDKSLLTETELREKWAEQTQRRARLTEIADLNVDKELSLPAESLNPWQLGMLELYLEDADRKLDSFADVLRRINLLEDVVNARLLRKSLRIDANSGIVVSRAMDGTSIPLNALSSGEQHEIILIFDLLFNVDAESLIMIDEPEISLHIGWQKQFISDVLRIADLVGFQFIVATHSPQIIDRWWSRATRLGPKTDQFLGDEGTDANA